jgi:hypothetical protein
MILSQEKTVEGLGASNPSKPEKCFFDFELIALHKTFVDALGNDPVQLKKIKGKILPAICILDMVTNKKTGWDKFLDSQGNRLGTSDRNNALKLYLTEQYDTAFAAVMAAGLEFMVKPYKLKQLKAGVPPPTDPTLPPNPEDMEEVEINIMQNLKDIILKKADVAGV